MRVNQNSGVSIVAKIMQFSSSKDKHPIYGDMKFYGVITEIWELDYRSFRIPVFKCDWIDSTVGIKEETGIILVDLSRTRYKDDPFIMATQAKQVFYVPTLDSKWSFVLSTQPRYIGYDDDNALEELKTFEKEFEDIDEFDDIETTMDSHVQEDGEAIWINRRKRRKTN